MKVYRDADISLTPLQNKIVAMLGYGNQGRPQALNLKDSGIQTIVGTRAGSQRAEQAGVDGFEVMPLADATKSAQVIMMQLPDEAMGGIFEEHIAPALAPGKYLGFSHGMAIHAGWVQPKLDTNVFLLAPKAQGRGVRNRYVEGSGVPGLVAVHQDPVGNTLDVALAYGKAIGCGRAGILPTTFAQETESDLFSEQTVLCGGLTQLIKTAFDVLVENGTDPAVAYFECLYEVKLIADLLQEGGLTYMRRKISSTALYGDLTQGENVIDGHVKESMRRVLSQIRSGAFAEGFLKEVAEGKSTLQTRLEADYQHPIERIGRELREHRVLPWPEEN